MDERHDRKIVMEVSVLSTINQNKYFKNVTFEQLIDGLDHFFSDYRNRSIDVNGGILVVLRKIRGDSESEINKMINALRKLPLETDKALRELQKKNKLVVVKRR